MAAPVSAKQQRRRLKKEFVEMDKLELTSHLQRMTHGKVLTYVLVLTINQCSPHRDDASSEYAIFTGQPNSRRYDDELVNVDIPKYVIEKCQGKYLMVGAVTNVIQITQRRSKHAPKYKLSINRDVQRVVEVSKELEEDIKEGSQHHVKLLALTTFGFYPVQDKSIGDGITSCHVTQL